MLTAGQTVAVIGLGKLGLPLAVQFATPGLSPSITSVIGVDLDPSVVERVNAGIEPWTGEADLKTKLSAAVTAGRLAATTDTAEAVAAADIIVIVVPLVIDEHQKPAYENLDAVCSAIGAHLRPGTLVSVETTVPVGTTRDRVANRLAEQSGLTPGTDLFVVHSPERVLTGRVFTDLRRYPKIVGGTDPASTARGVSFYESVLTFDDRPDLQRPNGVWPVASAETAEAVKLAETTYRNVNIALANEFARFADTADIDVYEVIEGANSQPFSHIHTPGVSVGGHCIPVYPHLYLHGDPSASLPRMASAVNESMPEYVVDLLAQHWTGDLTGVPVAVLGLSYRPGVKEAAFSGAPVLVDELRRRGAIPHVEDPLYSPEEIEELGLPALRDRSTMRAAVLHTAHEEWANLGSKDFPLVRVIIDGRNQQDPAKWTAASVVTLGRAPTASTSRSATPEQ